MKDKLYIGKKRIIRKYLKKHEEDLSKWFKDGGKITKEFMELLDFKITDWEMRGAFKPIKESNKYHCVKRFGNKMIIAFDINFNTGRFSAQYSCHNNKFLKKTGGKYVLRTLENKILEFPGEIINVINTMCLEGDSKFYSVMRDSYYFK